MNLKKYSKKGMFAFGAVLIAALALGFFSLSEGTKKTFPKNQGSSGDKPKAEFKSTGKKNSSVKIGSFKKFLNSEDDFKSPDGEYIAKIEISGTIISKGDTYNQKWIMETIKKLEEDKNNKGIILAIDSPGGGLYESDETYLALLEYKKNTGRPIYAYFQRLAASGAYYIACSADYIMANRNSLVGSIGTICGQFIDFSELMAKYGIKAETIHSGRNKIMGHPGQPLTDEQRQIMQSICDEGYNQFLDVVVQGRNMDKNTVQNLADGRIYTARQAQEAKLIDSTGSLEDLEDAMKRKEFDFKDYEIEEYRYTRPENFRSILMGAARDIRKSQVGSLLIPEIVEKKLENRVPFPALYCNQLD